MRSIPAAPVFPRRVLRAAFLLTAAVAAPLAAQPLALPAELGADAAEIRLEIDDATVEVLLDPAAPPTLRAELFTADTAERPAEVPATPPPTLHLTREEGRLTVRRATANEPRPEPIRVTLTVGPSQRLVAAGTRVRFELDASRRPAGETVAALSLDLADSEILLTAIDGAEVTARRSRLALDATRGTLTLTLDGSAARIRGHAGPLRLAGRTATAEVSRHRGRLDLDLEECDVTVSEGSSQLQASARGGSLRLDSWDGTGEVRGDGTRVEVRGLTSLPEQPARTTWLRVSGSGLEAVVMRFEGTFTAQLEGGSLDAGGLIGKSRITGRSGASIVLEDVRKSLDLFLDGGSIGRLRGAEGRVKVRMAGSTFEAEDVRLLGIDARASEVTVRRVTRMDTVLAADSRLDLRLPTVENDPALLLLGESVARVLLPSPCVVRLAAPVEDPERHLRVTGCTIARPGAGGVAFREEGAVILKTSLEGSSLLEVEGAPAP